MIKLPGRILIFSVLVLFLTGVSAHARQIQPLEGLEALRKSFSDITDFTAEITQEKQLSVMKRTLTMKGKVRFRKPGLFFMEINPPYASRIILRDSTIEQVLGDSKERSRIVLPPEQSLTRWFSKISVPIVTLPENMKVQSDLTGSLYTVTITPLEKGQVRELVISFSDDGAVKRLVISEQNGDRAVMTFHKVRRNVGLTDKDFRLD